jgi:Alpha/beta hydrolase domain
MQRWLTDGTPPPTQPKIEFAGDPPEVVRDEHGIARGGIRLPQVEVPLALSSSIPLKDDVFSYLQGSSNAFPQEKGHALYGDKASFLAKFEAAAQQAMAAGVLRPRDIAPLIAEANACWPA